MDFWKGPCLPRSHLWRLCWVSCFCRLLTVCTLWHLLCSQQGTFSSLSDPNPSIILIRFWCMLLPYTHTNHGISSMKAIQVDFPTLSRHYPLSWLPLLPLITFQSPRLALFDKEMIAKRKNSKDWETLSSSPLPKSKEQIVCFWRIFFLNTNYQEKRQINHNFQNIFTIERKFI